MSVEIWVALISLGGVIYASTVGVLFQYGKRKLKEIEGVHRQEIDDQEQEHIRQLREEREREIAKKEAEYRIEFHRKVQNPYVPLNQWQPVADQIETLCQESIIDRVLLLVALNGDSVSTHATVIWDYRAHPHKQKFEYVDVKLDPDYVLRMNRMVSEEYFHFKTEEAKGTLIGKYYEAEGVKNSLWIHLGKRNSINTDQVAYKFMSFATHEEGDFTSEDIRKIVNIAGEVKTLIYASGFTPVA